MEEALYDTSLMRRFAQLGGHDAIPDETTILNFRRLLGTHQLAEAHYRGLAKNTAQLLTLFALSNLWMVRRHLPLQTVC